MPEVADNEVDGDMHNGDQDYDTDELGELDWLGDGSFDDSEGDMLQVSSFWSTHCYRFIGLC